MDDIQFGKLVDNALLEFVNSESPSSQEEELRLDGFTKEELVSFLEEIEREDEDLAKEEIASATVLEENKLDDESNYVISDIINDKTGWFNKSKWIVDSVTGEFIKKDSRELFDTDNGIVVAPERNNDNTARDTTDRAAKIKNATRKWHENRDLRKIEINRMAFDQKILPLGDRISVEHKRLVIELLTRPIRDLITKYETYVNNRITKLLLPAIPRAVKLAQLKWPWIFVQNPGFMYKTHERMGPVKTFWTTPKVPYYFPQGTEQSVLEERDLSLTPYFLDCIDRAILRWYNAKENLAKREVAYAMKMINIKGNTYYHLLLLNPFWFEKLYEEIKNQREQLL